MSYDNTNMSTEEFRQHKENLRQKAFEAELNRLKQGSKRQKATTIVSLFVAIVMAILVTILWIYQTKPEKIIETKTVTVHDTIYSKPDTIFKEISAPEVEIVNFYSVQIGAYKKQEIPEFLKKQNDFPIQQFQYNDLNCFGFGKFLSVGEAEEARNFLKKIGFSSAVIIKIQNNQRVALIK